jgi:sensor histidine kinase regulating citrate/malate metabolism
MELLYLYLTTTATNFIINSTFFVFLIGLFVCLCLHVVFVVCMLFFFLHVAQQPHSGIGHLIIEVARLNSDTPHSVGLLWTNDQPDPETSI